MSELFNMISAAVCREHKERQEKPLPGGRRRYEWHRSDILKEMEVGDSIQKMVNKREYAIYRSYASRIGKTFGVRFHSHYENGILTITRER